MITKLFSCLWSIENKARGYFNKQKAMSTTEITKIVKTALAERFGFKNVSVKRGRGTASGWVDAKVEIERPHDCFCKENEPYCSRCKEQLRDVNDEARKRVYDAMQKAGVKFSTYYSDDGYNTERDCFLLHINFKK